MERSAGYGVGLPLRPHETILTAAAVGVLAASLTLVSAPFAGAFILFVVVSLIALVDVKAGVAAFVVIAPWTTVASILIGGRWVALGADLLLIMFAFSMLAFVQRGDLPRRFKGIAVGWLAVLVIAGLQMFNPRGLGLLGDLEGYRAAYLPLLALPVGYFIARRSPGFEQLAIRAIIGAIVIVAIMGIRQVVQLSALDEAIIENAKSDILPFTATGTNRLRAFSPLPGPFHFGFLMMIGITLVMTATMHRMRAWHGAILGVLLVALALNATRLNWMGTAAAIATILVVSLSPRHLHRWLPRLVVLLVLGAVVLRAVSGLAVFAPIQRFTADFLSNPLANTSYVYRVVMWFSETIPAIQAAPLIGYGTGMGKDALGPFSTHNLLLKLLIEGGVFLFIAYVGTVALILRELWRRRRSSVLARAAIALTVGTHAAGMFAPILDALPANEYYWLLLGVALAVEEPASDVKAEVATPK